MGFISDTTPGCLLHPMANDCDCRDLCLYGKEICDDYFCPAHRILDKRLKSILIQYTQDWYTYSIGIVDPESFKWIVQVIEETFGKPITCETVDECIQSLLNESLLMVADYLNTLKMPIFYYSKPEYYMNMQKISLNKRSEINAPIRDSIKARIDEMFNDDCS